MVRLRPEDLGDAPKQYAEVWAILPQMRGYESSPSPYSSDLVTHCALCINMCDATPIHTEH